MNVRIKLLAICLAPLMGLTAKAQGPAIPPGDKEPVLRLEAGGPTAFVTALTFSPDGKRLYGAGFDKVVRVWTLNEDTGRFVLDRAAYRIPIGPGINGTVNTIALSPDERWLAVGGQGIVRGTAGFRRPGLILPKTGGFTEEMWLDQGTIYIFDTQNRSVRPLRGHMGPVWSLRFAPRLAGKPQLLVSAGRDRDMESVSYKGSVRVWNVEEGTKLAERTDMPNSTGTRPGLAVFHTGKRPEQLRVGIAWEDGTLRVWDVADNDIATAPDGLNGKNKGKYNNTAALIPNTEDIITLTRQFGADMQMRRWNVGGNAPKETNLKNVTLDKNCFFFPRALTLVSSKANGNPDFAAMVLLWFEKKGDDYLRDYYLYLRDLDADNFGTYRAYVKLWAGGQGQLPAIASSPNGKHIAVAGNNTNTIRVYAIADILRKKANAEPQVLSSVGKTFRFSAFVRKGQTRGLLLGEKTNATAGKRPRDPAKGDVVFNFDTRNFSAVLSGWKIDAPAVDGWDVLHTASQGDAPAQIRVSRQGANAVTIKLKANEVVSDFAMLPAMAPLNVPIVAIAYHDLGQPKLNLYNARTGDAIRRFSGHSERIRSLAFSGDGRLLVSTAEDQTVCIWSMGKLEKYLGKLGRLEGVVAKNLIVVASAQAGAPIKGKLTPFDVIETVVRGGKSEKFFSLPKLYADLAALKPGVNVTLKVRAPQAKKTRDVSVPVHQGLVDRTRCLLLSVGLQNPLAMAGLHSNASGFSPLPGIRLRYAPIVVAGPEGSKLAKNDLIETVAEGGKKPRSVSSARVLYEAVALMTPGNKVVLGIRGKGNVALVVGQGSDERKPLFSLFVTQGDKVADWEWIGWSPIGPYEASGRLAERHIGWHFNTGDPDQPASFALADQYRKEYFREGILNDLVAEADLAEALRVWYVRDRVKEQPQPRLTLWIDEIGPDPKKRNGLGQFVARDLPIKLKLAIDDFPLDRVESVRWELGNGGLQKFASGRGREHTVDIDLKRGLYQLRAVIKTFENPPREYARELQVRILPPAPKLDSKQPRFQVAKAPGFSLQAIVEQNRNEAVQVQVIHRHKGKKVQDRTLSLEAGQKTLKIDEKLKLMPGENFIEVLAVNKRALPDPDGLETVRMSWAVGYIPPAVKVPPPQIVLERILPVGAPNPMEVPVDPGQPVVVNDSPVRLIGRIEGSELLDLAQWSRDKEQSALANFVANKAKVLDFAQELKLRPGVQTIVIRAKSARSEPAQTSVSIEYRPRLPEVLVSDPLPESIFYDEGKGAPMVNVTGVITRTNSYPAKAVLLVNDKPMALTLPDEGEAWTAKVPLAKSGVNRLQIRVTNEWEMTSTTEVVNIRYVRPPLNIRFEPPPPPKTPIVDLTAWIESPLPLIRESVEALVNDRDIVGVEIVPSKKQKGLFAMHLRDVPLDANKKNVIRLWVSNLEARCRQPGEITIDYKPPAQPPAKTEVEFLDPIKDINVTDPDIAVRFRVKSSTPLKRVEIVRTAGRDSVRESFDVSNVQPKAPGVYEFRKALRLTPRENRLRAVAVNAGGETQTAVVINYIYMPVQLIIDRLEPIDRRSKPVQPKVLPDQRLVFDDAAASGRLRLRGRVRWSKDNDKQLKKVSVVRVFVNGFQQIPAVLQPPKGASREREFVADLLLNRREDNRIEIELPDLKQDSNNRREFELACTKPATGQRLHLLIVGVGEKNEQELVNQALLALRAERDKQKITSPAFSEVRVYGPLTNFVRPQEVFTQLCLIKKTIDVLAAQGSPNDVVMVYYQGGEALKKDGNVFETSLSKYDKQLRRSGITFKGIQGFFDETLGAKLLWLDVTPVKLAEEGGKDEVAEMAPGANINVLRYRWLNRDLARKGGETLLKDWQRAMTRDDVGFLSSVNSHITSFYKERKNLLTYQSFIPEALAKLLVNRKME